MSEWDESLRLKVILIHVDLIADGKVQYVQNVSGDDDDDDTYSGMLDQCKSLHFTVWANLVIVTILLKRILLDLTFT